MMNLKRYIIYLIVYTVVINVLYFIVDNWDALTAINRCLTLKQLLAGQASRCFASSGADTCRQSADGYTQGWCEDNKSVMFGTAAGPIGNSTGSCKTWIWHAKDCPPTSCNELSGTGWGWCKDTNVAMLGSKCGPNTGICKNWVWDAANCCSATASSEPVKTKNAYVCGVIDGKKVPCPMVTCGNVCGNGTPCPPKQCEKCLCKKSKSA